MPDLLAIEWDSDRLIAAIGSLSGSQIRFKNAVSIERQEGELPSELGTRLKAELASAGIAETDATIVLPRRLVTLHRVQLPNLPESELAGLVKMQAATRVSESIDAVCLDFVPLPQAADADSRDVLLVTLPEQQLQPIRAALKVAGLELSGVRVSSFGVAGATAKAGLLQKSLPAGAVDAIVALSTDSIEMIYVKDGQLVFSHAGASWGSPDRIEQAVRSAVSRGRMAAAEDLGDYTVQRMTLIGDPEVTAAVPDSINQRLNNAEIVRVDPDGQLLTGGTPAVPTTDLLAVAGVIASGSSGLPNVDLVNPRKPAEKKDNRRLKMILALGAGALVLAGGWKWRESTIAGYKEQASALSTETNAMKTKYDSFSDRRNGEKKIDDALTTWANRDINWLDEMVRLRELMGGTDQVFVKRLDFSVQSGDSRGMIKAEGYAKSREAIEQLAKTLRQAGYIVAPPTSPPSQRDPDYGKQLTLEITLPDRPTESAKT